MKLSIYIYVYEYLCVITYPFPPPVTYFGWLQRLVGDVNRFLGEVNICLLPDGMVGGCARNVRRFVEDVNRFVGGVNRFVGDVNRFFRIYVDHN